MWIDLFQEPTFERQENGKYGVALRSFDMRWEKNSRSPLGWLSKAARQARTRDESMTPNGNPQEGFVL